MKRKGFTLIELSIVLIIIGLIIGGVMKGKDMINSAKQKKFVTTFVKGWELAVNQYQDRTGQTLGDGVLNGGTTIANGTFDNLNLSLAAGADVVDALAKVGIDAPITNTDSSYNGGSYTIEGKYARGTSVMNLTSANVNGSVRNVLQITLVPTDVAIAMDTMIDGGPDAGLGTCIRSTGAATATPTTALWPDANTATVADRTVTVYILL